MKADLRFTDQSLSFWAIVKLASERAGYSTRKSKNNPNPMVKSLTPDEIRNALEKQGIDLANLSEAQIMLASAYTVYRASVLNEQVEPALLDRASAKQLFLQAKRRAKPKHRIPMNRQKGDKRHEAYLAALVGILAEEVLGATNLVNDANCLAILTEQGVLQGIFSRRFDGAVPNTVDPVAIWEVKEYYGTTTFGSRVADGVYETLLDGFEIQQFEREYGRQVAHFLFVDDRFTWWEKGKSYLCRLIDMLHTGHVDEIFFGKQVITEWPQTLAVLRTSLAQRPPNRATKAADPSHARR